MIAEVVVDTGPLVAFLNRRDTHHAWALSQFASILPPMATCEAVLSEACFLLRRSPEGPAAVFELLRRGILIVPFRLADEIAEVSALLAHYGNVPMSLADACLVRMVEQRRSRTILTLDSDFRIYRLHKRNAVPIIAPGHPHVARRH